MSLAYTLSQYVVQILSGLGRGAGLFLVASGLTLIFGALRIVQFAHGSLYMIGAFLSVTLATAVGLGNGTFWLVLLVSGLFVMVAGLLMEIGTFRRIYAQPLLTQLLVTFAFVLVIEGAVRAIYGSTGRVTKVPPFLKGSVQVIHDRFSIYQIFLIGLAALIAVLLWGMLYRTNLGRMIRAAVADSELLALSGVNVRWLFTGVFALGAFFAGFAGAAVAPAGSVGLGLDIDVILKAFVVVVIGGLGSLRGALVGSALVGVADSLGILWVPQASLAIVFAVLVVVLALRPQGLFGTTRDVAIGQGAPLVGVELGRPYGVPLARLLAGRGLWLLAAVGIVVVGLMPFLSGPDTVLLMGEALILALFALSLNLIVGTTGLMSFGHAAYYGFGAFTVAILVAKEGWPPLATFALAPLVGAVAAFVSGLVVLRGTALFFGLLTLGVAQLYWAAAQGWVSLTGGQNGLPGSYVPSWLRDLDNLYWFVFGCVAFCTLLLFIITRSPFGDALRGIRENRRRAEFIGIWPKRYELAAFVIAGTFAAIAGGLATMFENLASSDFMDWRSSAAPLIVSLIGGIGHFLGPALGAVFYTFLQDYIIARTVLWDVALGVAVLVVALLVPGGLTSGLRWLVSAVAAAIERLRGVPEVVAPPIVVEGAPEVVHLPEVQALAEARARAAAGADGAPVLTIEQLRKSFGGLVAVNDVSLTVRRGTIHAIIGPNGAGKTTLFNLITGLLEPDAGRVLFDGQEVTDLAPWRIVKRGVGRSFQQTNLFWALSSFANVLLAHASARNATQKLYGGHAAELRQETSTVLDRVGLGGFSGVPAMALSHGDQRSLELAAALAVQARLLLLDEPTAGLSPTETKTAVRLIERIAREEGLTVLFIEHDMEVVFGAADRITVLHRGAVLAEGPPAEIRANKDVQRAYLGEAEETHS